MSLFSIGDLHLSFSSEKPMDIFKGWDGYTDKLFENWQRMVSPEDTVVICGDISWAMTLEELKEDFAFIHRLNGKKIILKGNHDYWWDSMKKLTTFVTENGFDSISFLHNNAYLVDGIAVCGTRGWVYEGDAGLSENDKKIVLREAGRLQTSVHTALNLGGQPVAFLHYPPVFSNYFSEEILKIIKDNGIKFCYYGHIHGSAAHYARRGLVDGIYYRLVSCDYTEFYPVKVEI